MKYLACTLWGRFIALILTLGLLSAGSVRATVYYWDPEGTTTTATPAGTWDTTSAQWSTTSALTATPVAWLDNVAACFSAGSSATGTYSVEVDQTINCAGIFNGALTPPGCFVTLTGTGALNMASGSAIDTAGSNGGTTTIGIPMIGAGSLVFEGSKAAFLHATNTFTGGTQLGYSTIAFTGTINFNNGSAFGTGPIQWINGANCTLAAEGTDPMTISNAWTAFLSQNVNFLANPAGVTWAGNWIINSGISPTFTLTGSGNLMTVSGVISGAGGFTKLGASTLKLDGANTYTGITTISNGTLALSPRGYNNYTSRLNIFPGANGSVFDVSAQSAYVIGSSTTLYARGTGTGTTTASMIRGAAGGTVSLGSRPVILAFTPTGFTGDTTHPALYVTQGNLVLNNNTFTVTNSAASPLGTGTYRLVQVASGVITSSPNPVVSVVGSGIASNTFASLVVSGGTVNLVIKPPAVFSNFAVNQKTAVGVGVQTVTLSGRVAGTNGAYPAFNEAVSVNLNGVLQTAHTTNSSGDFSTTFNLSAIPYLASNYPVTYSYTGDAGLGGVTNVTKVFANWFFQTGALPGFSGGFNLSVTNASGIPMYAWSTTNPCLPVASWDLEGQLSEGALSDVPGQSRYSWSANPTVPVLYYILGPSTNWPYASPTSISWITTDGDGNQAFYSTNVSITAAGIPAMPAPPVVVQQTGDQTVLAGKSVTFKVVSTGTPVLSYQWYTNSAPFSGATTATFALQNITADMAGSYSVVVSNQYGTTTSVPAVLTVLPPPQMTVAPASGGSVELTGTAAPSQTYIVQTTSDLTPPANWTNLTTNSADANGLIDFIDTNIPSTNLFYRLQFP